MAVCISCGKEFDGCLCDDCKQRIDIEDYCAKIRAYVPMIENNPEINPVWEQVAAGFNMPGYFKNVAFALAEYLPSPRKEIQQIKSIVGTGLRVPRNSKPWFYEVYAKIKGATSAGVNNLSTEERLRLDGLMLECLYQDYRYVEADKLAIELLAEGKLPWETVYVIAEFFSQTRRYDEADDTLSTGMKLYGADEDICRQFTELSEKNKTRRKAANEGKKEYLPNPKENKADAIANYTEFMASIGIDVNVPSTSKSPTPIPKGEYPEPVEKREADFDSFVAFDFETTGITPARDAIIEVGAIKVVNGKLVETSEFTFREFVKPFKQRLSDEVIALTGITKDDVNDARQMWEVIPDFMKFVGDDILVGFNSIGFDAKFLCRAGRYCNTIYTNQHFDVCRYLKDSKESINYTGENFKLSTVGEFFNIENPEAHRALSDAITTAKIYLKLKDMSVDANASINADNILDLEDW